MDTRDSMGTKGCWFNVKGVFVVLMRYNGMDPGCWCIARSGVPRVPAGPPLIETPVDSGRNTSITCHGYVFRHISLSSWVSPFSFSFFLGHSAHPASLNPLPRFLLSRLTLRRTAVLSHVNQDFVLRRREFIDPQRISFVRKPGFVAKITFVENICYNSRISFNTEF